MPVWNAEEWIGETLQSLADQTLAAWELVVVDDGSSDSSIEIVKLITMNWIQPVRIIRTVNRGPSVARNLGIASSLAEFIAFLDSDDLWEPDKLEEQVSALRTSPAAVGCVCGYRAFCAVSHRVLHTYVFEWNETALLKWLLAESFGPGLCSTLLVRSAALEATGGFDERLQIYEDFDLAWRLNSQGTVLSLPDVLMEYRLSASQNHRDANVGMRDFQQMMERDPLAQSPSLQRRAQANMKLIMALRQGSEVSLFGRVLLVSSAFRLAPLQPFRLLRGWLERRLR